MKLKKGTIFKNDHIRLKNDVMYISDIFAQTLIPKDKILGKCSCTHTNHYIIYDDMYKLSIYLIKRNNNEYLIAGSSGTHGFCGGQQYKKYTLGLKVKRKTYKYLIDIYNNDIQFNREEKLKRILK